MTVLRELRRALLALLGSAGIAFAICAMGMKPASGQELSIQVKDRFLVKTWYWARTKDVDQQCGLVPGAALEVREQSTEKGIELVYLPLNAETPRNACAKFPNGKVFRFGTKEQFLIFAKTVLCMSDEPSEMCKQMIEASMRMPEASSSPAKVALKQ